MASRLCTTVSSLRPIWRAIISSYPASTSKRQPSASLTIGIGILKPVVPTSTSILVSPSGTSLWFWSHAFRKSSRDLSSSSRVPGTKSRQSEPRMAAIALSSSLRSASVSVSAAASAVGNRRCLATCAAVGRVCGAGVA
jgi:hypothetical protein